MRPMFTLFFSLTSIKGTGIPNQFTLNVLNIHSQAPSFGAGFSFNANAAVDDKNRTHARKNKNAVFSWIQYTEPIGQVSAHLA